MSFESATKLFDPAMLQPKMVGQNSGDPQHEFEEGDDLEKGSIGLLSLRLDYTEVEQASMQLEKLVLHPESSVTEASVSPCISDEEKDLMRRMTCEQTQNCFQSAAGHCEFLKKLHEPYTYFLDLVGPRPNQNIHRHMTLKKEIQAEYDRICAHFFEKREKTIYKMQMY